MPPLRSQSLFPLALVAVSSVIYAGPASAQSVDRAALRSPVDAIVEPLMEANAIPGMAVGISIDGEPFILNYGSASPGGDTPVDDRTLFEIGSLAKPFTGLLGAYVAARGAMTLDDPASLHDPALEGSVFDDIRLADLATYTAGGLPLQFPDHVTTDAETTNYYLNWTPDAPPGTQRLYSNPSIGLFGDLAAKADDSSFEALMTDTLLPAFGLSQTFLNVPSEEMDRYAFGMNRDGETVRVNPGAFDDAAYGIKTTASDLVRFLDLNMNPSALDETLQNAIAATQTGYVRFGETLQGLGWEIYDATASLETVLAGSTTAIVLEPQPATAIEPPQPPRPDRFVNKTGSTGGFGAYAAFWPNQRIAIALLANRNYPTSERIEATWAIYSAIEELAGR